MEFRLWPALPFVKQSRLKSELHVLFHWLKVCGHFNRQHDTRRPALSSSRASAGGPRLLIRKVDRVDHHKLFLSLDLIDEGLHVGVLTEYCESKADARKHV